MKKSREQQPNDSRDAEARRQDPENGGSSESSTQEKHHGGHERHHTDQHGRSTHLSSSQEDDGSGLGAAASENGSGNGRATARPEDLAGLQAQLEAKEREARESRDQYVRTLADVDNMRKRYQREKEEAVEYANSGLVLRLLPILDNFELAIKHSETGHDFEGLLQGVKQILKQMQETLEKEGVTPIAAVGQPFNPDEHEALGHVPSDDYPEGTVAQDLRTGYRMKGRCIRPSLVRVAGG